MDVKRYVKERSDRITVGSCRGMPVVLHLLTALKARKEEIDRELREQPMVVQEGVVTDDWRVKLGESRGLEWLDKLISETEMEIRKS